MSKNKNKNKNSSRNTQKTQAESIKESLNSMVHSIEKEIPQEPPSEVEENTLAKKAHTESLEASKEGSKQKDLEVEISDKSTPKETQITSNAQSVTAEPTKAKGAGLALLVGLVGLGLGGYSVYHLTHLDKQSKSDALIQLSEVKQLVSEIDGNQASNKKQLEQLSQQLESSRHISKNEQPDVDRKLADLSHQQAEILKQQQSFKTQLLQTLEKTEQASQQIEEGGSVDQVSGQANEQKSEQAHQQLNDQAQQITSLQKQVDELLTAISLLQTATASASQGQIRLVDDAELISSVAAKTTEKVERDLNKKEVSYLVNMAINKLSTEQDVESAKKLLQNIKEKSVNDSQFNQGFNQLVDQHIESLKQLEKVDLNLIESSLNQIVDLSGELLPKPVKTKSEPLADRAKEDSAKEDSMLDKIKSVALSGIKFTPKDPSQVDISKETALIEKQLIKADVEQIKLALKNQDVKAWNRLLEQIKHRLDHYFESNETAEKINQQLASLQTQKITVTLPVMDDLKTYMQ